MTYWVDSTPDLDVRRAWRPALARQKAAFVLQLGASWCLVDHEQATALRSPNVV
jgi:hypothetical protein